MEAAARRRIRKVGISGGRRRGRDRSPAYAWRRRSAAQAVAAWELLWWATEATLASCYPRGRPTSDARDHARGRRIPIRADLHAIDATLIPSSRRLI